MGGQPLLGYSAVPFCGAEPSSIRPITAKLRTVILSANNSFGGVQAATHALLQRANNVMTAIRLTNDDLH